MMAPAPGAVLLARLDEAGEIAGALAAVLAEEVGGIALEAGVAPPPHAARVKPMPRIIEMPGSRRRRGPLPRDVVRIFVADGYEGQKPLDQPQLCGQQREAQQPDCLVCWKRQGGQANDGTGRPAEHVGQRAVSQLARHQRIVGQRKIESTITARQAIQHRTSARN